LVEWLTALREGVAALTRTAAGDAWQTGGLQREFADVLAAADFRSDTRLRLADVRSLLGRHLAGRPTRANFRTGTLTVCTMVPMRSVPHRVVCLVGLDDGVFPRFKIVDGDDVLARRPMTGDRDIRSEDRQLLLDAIGAATETLVVTYTGCDEHTGQRRPPAVPLVELLDTLDQTTPASVRDRVLVEHPLQPFDIDNVTPGILGVPTAFTFDTTAVVAARAAAGERSPDTPFFTRRLPEPPAGDVTLIDLLDFFSDPAKGFFRALDFTLPWDVDSLDDAIPVDIDPLQEWAVGHRMLSDMLSGMDPNHSLHAEWRRGSLPPGHLGWRKAKEIRDRAGQLATTALRHRHADPQAHDVDVDLGSGRRLTGTVSPVFSHRTVSVTYSKLAAKHLLGSWIPLVALAAHIPGGDWTALCIGRGKSRNRIAERLFGPPLDPVAEIRQLVALYDAGRREPLPLPLKTSYAWAAARQDGNAPEGAAGDQWVSTRFRTGDDQQRAHETVWGRRAPLGALLVPPLPGEEVAGEDTRLGALALRLWEPLLRAERDTP